MATAEISVDENDAKPPSENDIVLKLAQTVCQAAEQGEFNEVLSALNIPASGRDSSHGSISASDECNQLLFAFCKLIGYRDIECNAKYAAAAEAQESLVLPHSVRAYLLLRGLLRIPHERYCIPWEAATAAVKALQFNSSDNHREHNNLSHGEQLAMLAEIRSFVTCLRIGPFLFWGDDVDDSSDETKLNKTTSLINTLQGLFDIGMTIITPMLRPSWNGNINMESLVRRKNSFLLPLELLPAIIATADILGDSLAEMRHNIGKDNATEDVDGGSQHAMRDDAEEENDEPATDSSLCTSDKLLSTLFPYPGDEEGSEHVRSIRADSALSLLALAIDDNLFARMTCAIPTNARVSYWDCLRYGLDDIIFCNMACYSNKDEYSTYDQNLYECITNEANFDEGVHVIPPSDYPALIRCVLRMISIGSSQKSHRSSVISKKCWGWESLLFRLYHATAVATSTLPILSPKFRKKRNSSDHMATLATVESHVLVPSFSGASVSTVKSILDACALECCPSCRQNALLLEATDGNTAKKPWSSSSSAPTWAVAGVVLSMMRARSSNILQSSHSVGFGPRTVFRMASEMLNRANSLDDVDKTSSFDDEISYALRVLLSMPGISEGACFACPGNDRIRDSDRCAYEVLKVSYYAADSCFQPRYEVQAKQRTYQSQLGLDTLSSYSKLIRCSLHQGGNHELDTRTLIDSGIADAAKTWMETAIMLLDDERYGRGDSREYQNQKRHSCYEGDTMALVILVVIFCEVPSSRPHIVRHLLERFTNITSRELHCFDKRNAEKLFVLLSVLAWSLTEWTEKSTSPHVFQKESRDATSALDPLCSLLSTSRQKEFFSSIESASISYRTLHHLSRALSTVPSARDAILALAKKHMRLLSIEPSYSINPARVRTFFESMPPNSSEHRDSVYFAIECLCILVQRRHLSVNSEPDECELEAAKILSDVIVLQRPSSFDNYSPSAQLSPDVSLWVCRRLENLASSSKLSKWSSCRLMRGCFMSLSQSYASIQLDDNSHLDIGSRVASQSMNARVTFAPKLYFRTRKDIHSLLSLSSSLFKFLADEEILLKSWHHIKERILRALLSESELQYIAENKDYVSCGYSYDILRHDFYGDDTCDFTKDGILLAFFIEGAARHLKSQHHQQSCVDEHIMNNIRNNILRNEMRHYVESSPNWIDFTSTWNDSCETRRMRCDGEEASTFPLAICDFMVEIILGVNCRADENESDSQYSEDNDGALHAIDCILQIKRQAMKSVSPVMSKELPNSGSISRHAVCHLFNLSCQKLHLLLGKTENRMNVLPEVDLLLQNIIDFSNLSSTDSIDRGGAGGVLLSSLINLYSSTSDEKSSKLLISFVEDAYYNAGQWAQESRSTNSVPDSQSQFTLQHISSANILDCRVRHLRSIVLSALSRELDKLAISQSALSSNDAISTFDLLSKSLRNLCEDLGAGYLGHSGGMTRSLFLIYLGAIGKCVEALSDLMESATITDECRLKSGCITFFDAMESIWGTLCDYSLRQTSILKSTARLCFDQMPTLMRKSERVMTACIFQEHVHKFSIRFIVYCIDTFLDNPRGEATEKAAYGQIRTGNHDSNATKQKSHDSSIEENQPLHNCEDSGAVSNISLDMKKPVLLIPEQLSTVLSIALSGMAKTWHESYKLISSVEDRRPTMSQHSKELLKLASRRRIETSNFLSAMYKLFEDDPANMLEKDEIASDGAVREENEVKDLVASRLSFHGMANFCTCLEKISMTLVASVKRLVKYFNHVKHSFLSCDEERRLVESMVCIIGWICSRNLSKHDILTGTMHWYVVQREKVSLSGGDDNYPILGRLPKVIYRLDCLETELLNLLNILSGDFSHLGDNAKTQKLRWFDSTTTALSRVPGSDDDFDFVELLKKCISDTDAKKREMNFESNYEESNSSSDSNDDDFMTNIGRKRRVGATSRRTHRFALRSRNETIDQWLAMDDDEFGSEPGERYNVDDAFVDLEDFLVEG